MMAKKKVTGNKSHTSAKKNSGKPDDILRYIKLAMETEKRGIDFYTEAKKKVDDYNMTRLMDVLLDQECIHLKFFTEIYNAEKKKGIEEAGKKAAEYKGQPAIKNPLFSTKHLQEAVKKKTTIYHLFRQAVEFEQDGHDLYMDLAGKVKNSKISAFLKMVAKEELKHKDFILMHQDAIYNTGHWLGWDHVRLET
ncbi:ferritin family protein [Candidatus Woesearchaeota archaeon]|nr:ferritin family protein [Candidatus Woesearchaeota archaeon]